MIVAAALIMRTWGDETQAHQILGAAGFDTLQKLKDHGVQQYDIDALAPMFPESDACPICAEVIKEGDLCATDIEMGTCHAACLDGAAVVDLETGEPSDGPISTFVYEEDTK